MQHFLCGNQLGKNNHQPQCQTGKKEKPKYQKKVNLKSNADDGVTTVTVPRCLFLWLLALTHKNTQT